MSRGLIQLTALQTDSGTTNTVLVNFTGTPNVTAGDDFYVDFFTFGDGLTLDSRVNNAIYRFELEDLASTWVTKPEVHAEDVDTSLIILQYYSCQRRQLRTSSLNPCRVPSD